jgi:hypothetical protein
MPHEKIQHNLQSFESLVRKLKNAYVERYEEEILTANRANIRLKIRFQSGDLFFGVRFFWVNGMKKQ